MTRAQVVFGVVVAIGLVGLTFYLTRKRLISERLMLLWLAVSLALFTSAIFPQPLFAIAGALGFVVTSNAIFTFAVLVLFGFNLFVTTKLTVLDQRLRRLAQEQALASYVASSAGEGEPRARAT